MGNQDPVCVVIHGVRSHPRSEPQRRDRQPVHAVHQRCDEYQSESDAERGNEQSLPRARDREQREHAEQRHGHQAQHVDVEKALPAFRRQDEHVAQRARRQMHQRADEKQHADPAQPFENDAAGETPAVHFPKRGDDVGESGAEQEDRRGESTVELPDGEHEGVAVIGIRQQGVDGMPLDHHEHRPGAHDIQEDDAFAMLL